MVAPSQEAMQDMRDAPRPLQGGHSPRRPPAPPPARPALWLPTQRHADAVALGVEEAPDLGEVAVEPPVVLVHGGLEQEGVAGVEDTGNAFLRALDKHTGLLGLHVVPHALVRLVP